MLVDAGQRRLARVQALASHIDPVCRRPVAPSPASTAEVDDPYRVPVIVGVSRIVRGPAQGYPKGKSPTTWVKLAAEAVREAAADSGAGEKLMARVEVIGVPITVTTPAVTSNPPWLLEQELGGAVAAHTHYYGGAGSSGQHYINDFARQIVTGQLTGAALLAHGECMHSARAFSAQESQAIAAAVPKAPKPPRSLRAAEMPALNPGEELQQQQERMHGITAPNYTYQGYENAIRAKNGETMAEHRRVVGKILSRFSDVAAADPQHAWFPEHRTPEEIVTASDANRMVSGPFYTVKCCAFNNIDMAAADFITSLGVARELGVPEEKLVYIHGTASCFGSMLYCDEPDFAQSDQHRIGFREAFAMAQLRHGPGDIDFFEIYCPYAVMAQLAAQALNLQLDDPRGWTITGAHMNHGAPSAGYGATQVAAMTLKMRENRGKIGCVSGTGGLNRNTISFGIYSTDPPAPGLYDRFVPPARYNAEIASVPRPTFVTKPEGDCWLETYIVHHGGASAAPNASDPRGPNLAACVGRLVSNGHRFVANTAGTYNDDGATCTSTACMQPPGLH